MNYMTIPGLKYKNHIRFQSTYMSKEMIVLAVLDYYNLSWRQLCRRDRTTSLRWPRQVIMYLLKKNTSLKLKDIGAIFDFDHSTVIHAVQKVQDMIDTDEVIRQQLSDITNKF